MTGTIIGIVAGLSPVLIMAMLFVIKDRNDLRRERLRLIKECESKQELIGELCRQRRELMNSSKPRGIEHEIQP